ncbi:uncharacterized protein LOC120167406 [Hibiscus syriacus]|uniref:uncharacterized protein LOC120167406 n=1 Tax=Hibiscus syriacus TaxID=106335 RepID=UPI0019245B5E|nr:uncharacterized protein LOC120167406 [Hibiscus syriacus]
MAAPTSSLKRFISFNLLIIIAIFCCNLRSTNAQKFPAESLANAFFCFNNKYIYTGCDEAYRLNESGNLNVPREATDVFCNGPCLAETRLVLQCVDDVLSGFVFYNKATVRDITNVLRAGCSYTSTRGNFGVGDYFQGGISDASRLGESSMISLSTLTLIVVIYVLIL